MTSVFFKEPIKIDRDIPIFSIEDDYISNYQTIAVEQLKGIEKTGENPWIEGDLWSEMELSTSNLIKKYAKPNDTILDVGVGLGRLMQEFPYLNRYGIDISLDLLEISKKKGINVAFSRIEDMPYNNNLFDIVVCTDVLEHVIDLNYCANKILDVLKPNGYLIIRVPYKEDLKPYIEKDYPFKYAHLRSFDESSLILLFTRIIKNCVFIESSLSGYYPFDSRLKYSCTFPYKEKFLKIVWHLSKKYSCVFEKIFKGLYMPIEFNIIFQKKL